MSEFQAELFHRFFEHCEDAMFVFDEERLLICNPAAVRLFGYDAAQTMLGLTPQALSPERQPDGRLSAEAAKEKIQKVVADGHHRFDWIHQRANGETFEAEISMTPDVSEAAHRIYAVVRDVTQVRHVERELVQAQEFTSALMKALPVAVFYKDQDGRYLGCNATFEQTMGIRSEQIIGKTVDELWPSELAKVYHQKDMELIQNPEHQTYEFEVTNKEGRRLEVIFAKDVFHDAEGRVAGMVGTFIDVTEMHELREQLNLASRMEALGQLAGGISHDFNNLLQVIIGYAEIAKDKVSESNQAGDFLQEIIKAGKNARELVEQLLAFSRQQKTEPEYLDVNREIEPMLKMLSRLIGPQVEIQFFAREPARGIYVDRTQLQQILMNLLVNARDAMPRGGEVIVRTDLVVLQEEKTGVLGACPAGPYVTVSVADQGCGMDAQTRQRIFEPFFTTKSAGKGTGLGLATVYGIVQQNRGFIDLDSSPDAGTTLTVGFPLASLDSEPRKDV